MADVIYADPDTDDILINDLDEIAAGEDTECECCQECIEGEEPTADFSYEQTNDDPCTINLFDESTVHANCEGEIVEWEWYKNGETTPFSTDQNPTGVVVEDGDDIRLRVKDSCGCSDEVVGGVSCEPMCCGCIIESTSVRMTFSGCTHPSFDACVCIEGMNGINRVMTFGSTDCSSGMISVAGSWTGRPFPPQNGNGEGYDCTAYGGGAEGWFNHNALLEIFCQDGVRTVKLTHNRDPHTGGSMIYQITEPVSNDCSGGWDLPWHSSPGIGFSPCGTGCTAHIRWV